MPTDVGYVDASAPQRIQLRRTRGWRKPEGAIKVDRTTVWGNPFKVGAVAPAANWPESDPRFSRDGNHTVADAEEAVDLFREMVRRGGWYLCRSYGKPDGQILTVGPMWQPWEPAARLAGHDLACWCPLPEPGEPDHCHAAVLLAIANGGAS
ncbi:DUF4326 domain-containing protein [Xylanimonas protaetiae]|uniref:DUF4326 domain-containing protein n=1 Tax=Xylanimonas protaetiae TaxID=2509457 RepID=A0A4P6FDS2_9MICO|nr:DUF4326 domain-containing protein [Xylanimonas protaetiae]